MNIKKLKEQITVEQIIKLVEKIGGDNIYSKNDNEIQFKTICHCGNSHKLYFYKDTKQFHCYSNCGQMDIVGLVQRVNNSSISDAVIFICEMFGFKNDIMVEGFNNSRNENLDMDILTRYDNKDSKNKADRVFKVIDEKILDVFYKYYHPSFYNDGISVFSMYKFGIRYDILSRRIIIPHRDETGKLISIRCRNLDQELIDNGLKYTPITINNTILSARTSQYLFGLFQNGEAIRKAKRVVLFESEKSVMQLDTMFDGSSVGVAVMGSSLSKIQIELLVEFGVEEVVVAFDKEFDTYGSNEEKAYATKIRKGTVNKLKPYFSVSVIWDRNNYLNKKDSPTDRGKDVFDRLFRERIIIK